MKNLFKLFFSRFKKSKEIMSYKQNIKTAINALNIGIQNITIEMDNLKKNNKLNNINTFDECIEYTKLFNDKEKIKECIDNLNRL